MSLLMDALRRAEQEKKQQAKQSGQDTDAAQATSAAEAETGAQAGDATAASMTQTTTVQSPYAGSEDVTMQIEPAEVERAEAAADASLDEMTVSMSGVIPPLDEDDEPAAENTDDIDPAPAPGMVADGDDSQMLDTSLVLDESVLASEDELSLEPMEGDEPAAEPDPGAGISADDTSTHSMALPADLTGGTTVSSSDRVDQTATMPSSRAVEQDLNAYFDQSQSMEVPRRNNADTGARANSQGSSQAGDLTLEDVAAHTVVGAQTIFSAKERPRSRRLLVAATIIAIGLVVSIGVVGLFYAQRDPAPPPVPPPNVADGVERPPVRELPVVPLEPEPAEVTNEIARIDTTIVGELGQSAAVNEIAQSTTAPAVTETTEVPTETEQAVVPTDKDPAPEIDTKDVDTQVAAAPAPGQSHATVAAASPSSVPVTARAPAKSAAASADVGAAVPSNTSAALRDVGAGELRIARKRRPAAVDEDVAAAYAAFQAGELDSAATRYQTVIARNAGNRDARFGLAAIAVAKGDIAGAYDHYRAVLDQHPNDAVATAGILAISGGNDQQTASRLRQLAETYKDSPNIHFALGNWYARKARWRDAQQAYFDAVRLDDGNADYAYNLAISLDHLGQVDAARDYYQKAISLNSNGSAAFDAAAASSRLNSISASP